MGDAHGAINLAYRRMEDSADRDACNWTMTALVLVRAFCFSLPPPLTKREGALGGLSSASPKKRQALQRRCAFLTNLPYICA